MHRVIKMMTPIKYGDQNGHLWKKTQGVQNGHPGKKKHKVTKTVTLEKRSNNIENGR